MYYYLNKEEGKGQESIQSSTCTTPAPNRKVTKTQEIIRNKKAKMSALSQQVTARGPHGCKKKHHSMAKTNTSNKKDPQKKHCLGTVRKKITKITKII